MKIDSKCVYLSPLEVIIYSGVFLFLLSMLGSCYTKNKAINQFGRAATTYPELPAEYCAIHYPAKDSLIKGDTVTRTDTMIIAGDQFFDTVRVGDTIIITKTSKPEVKTITQRITVHDTIVRVNTAEVDLCRINNTKLTGLLNDTAADRDKCRKTAKKRFWILFGIGAAAVLGIVFLATRKKHIPRN